MERELRKKTYASKKVKPRSKTTRGGSSTNPGGQYEDHMVRTFPTNIEFSHRGKERNLSNYFLEKLCQTNTECIFFESYRFVR